jgi:hypothetical protein
VSRLSETATESSLGSKRHPCAEAPSNKYKAQGNQPAFDVPCEMHRILGVDLTAIPGMSAQSVFSFFCEVGPQITRFRIAARILVKNPETWRDAAFSTGSSHGNKQRETTILVCVLYLGHAERQRYRLSPS